MKGLRKILNFFWGKFFEQILRKTLLLFIGLYRCHLSGFLGGACRFFPSCSCYAEEALQNLPLKKACCFIFKRLMRCHPLQKNYGYDPVEEKK